MSQGRRIRGRLEEITDELRNIEAQRFKLGRLPPWQEVSNPAQSCATTDVIPN